MASLNDHESIRDHCLGKKGAEESFPFGESTLVFKVGGKMFALLSLDANPPEMNLKCEPALAEKLREDHPNVKPGYHMNKRHWNTVVCDGSVSARLIREWIDHSYALVIESLPQKIKKELGK